MKYTIAEELHEIYAANPLVHDQSGKEENDALIASELTYHEQPIKMLYLPKAYTKEGRDRLAYAGEFMWKILIKVIEEYLRNPSYRKLFGFEPELEQMILNRPSYECLLPLCRLDIFLNEDTGDFAFCEFNADGASAMNENRIMGELFSKTKIYEELAKGYQIQSFELFDSWVKTFRTLCEQAGVETPQVAVVDFLEKAINRSEFDRFAEAFARAGLQSQVAEIRDLSFDGEHLYSKEGMRIDAIYRRAVTSDLMQMREEIPAFWEAVREKKVILIGDFITQVIHDKIIFRVLHMEQTRTILTAEENRFVDAHVPFTAILGPIHANRPDIRQKSKEWIIKPEDSYGAEGVYYSGEMSLQDWQRQLDLCSQGGFIIQEYIRPFRTRNLDYSKTDYEGNPYQDCLAQEKSPYMHSFANMTGLYLYGGKLSGIYSRLSPLNIISVEGDEHEMVSILVEEKIK